jgi:hypothetical protein
MSVSWHDGHARPMSVWHWVIVADALLAAIWGLR